MLDRRAKVMGIAYHEFIISTTGGDYKNPSFFLTTHNSSKVGVRDRNIWLKYKGFLASAELQFNNTLEPPNNMTHYRLYTHKDAKLFCASVASQYLPKELFKKNS